MNAGEVKNALNSVPDDSDLYIVIGEDCYPAKVRVFQAGRGRKNRTAYVVLDEDRTGEHRNFPEGYLGTRELVKLG